MGEDAADILDTTDISSDDRKQYSQIISKFDKYFKVRKNLVHILLKPWRVQMPVGIA